MGPFHVYKRPGLDRFLAGIAESFQLGVWSSASEGYVNGISQHIAPNGRNWKFVWNRDRCVVRLNPERMETEFVKDLRKVKRLGFDLSRVLAIDDTPHKMSHNYGNAIYVRPFEGAITDDELPLLRDYLLDLRDRPNYRAIEKRGWRSSAQKMRDNGA